MLDNVSDDRSMGKEGQFTVRPFSCGHNYESQLEVRFRLPLRDNPVLMRMYERKEGRECWPALKGNLSARGEEVF